GVLLHLVLDAFLQSHDGQLQYLHRLDHAGSQNHLLLHPLRHAGIETHTTTPFSGRLQLGGMPVGESPDRKRLQNARRPSKASASIWLLANSSTEPDGRPRAKRVRRTPVSASRFEMYRAVPSPSVVGLVAMITSRTLPCRTRRSRLSTVNCSGPM